MTLLKPSLFVNRLMVLAGDHRGYDERFGRGLNLISGDSNSVGKSTIANLIAYALGYDFTNWTPEVLRFDAVLIEVEINGATITLKRDLTSKRQRPMDVYWGTLEDANAASWSDWQRFPFSRSESKDSFSSLLFKLLELPEVHTDLRGKLTMHQLLRLMMVDQSTPYDSMFGSEQFDSPTTRREVGAILCGYYSDREYKLRASIREKAGTLQEIKVRQKILDEFVLDAEQDTSVLSIKGQLEEAQRRLRKAESTVSEALNNPKTRKEVGKEYERQLAASKTLVETHARTVSQSAAIRRITAIRNTG